MKRFGTLAAAVLAAALFCFASCGGETKAPGTAKLTGDSSHTETMKATDSAESTDERVTEPTIDTPVLTTGVDRGATSEAATTGNDHVQAITEDTWRDFTYAFTYQEQEYSLNISLPKIYDRLDDRTFFISDYNQLLMRYQPQYIY